MAGELEEKESAPTSFVCAQCKAEGRSESRCLNCEVSLCQNCAKIYASSEITRGHALSSADDLKAARMAKNVELVVCSEHKDKMVKLFCRSCQEAICQLCEDITHQDHDVFPIENIAAKEKDEMRTILERVKSGKDRLSEKLSNVVKDKEGLKVKTESIIAEISNYFADLTRIIQKRKNELVEQVTSLTTARDKELEGRQEHLELILASCESSIDCTEQAFATENDAQILNKKNLVLECLNNLNKEVHQKHPIVDDSMEFVKECSVKEIDQTIMKRCCILGDVACPEKSTALFKAPKPFVVLRKNSTVTVFCKDKEGREMKSGGQSITPIFTGVKVEEVTVRDNNNGSYDTTFVAQEVGTLKFRALINGHPAPNCSLSKKINWVMRDDVGSGTMTDGGLTMTGDRVLGSWCYRIGDCFFDAGICKWKVQTRYFGGRSRFSFKKEIELGVVDYDGDLSPSGIKSGHTRKWSGKFTAEVIVSLKLDMAQKQLTIQSTGGVDEMNCSIPPSQCNFQVAAKRVTPFLALRGKHLSLSLVHI